MQKCGCFTGCSPPRTLFWHMHKMTTKFNGLMYTLALGEEFAGKTLAGLQCQPEVSVSTGDNSGLDWLQGGWEGGGARALFPEPCKWASRVVSIQSLKLYRVYVVFFFFNVNLNLPSSWRMNPELCGGRKAFTTTELDPHPFAQLLVAFQRWCDLRESMPSSCFSV